MGINKPISLDGQTVNVDLTSVNDKLEALQTDVASMPKSRKTYLEEVVITAGTTEAKALTLNKGRLIKLWVTNRTTGYMTITPRLVVDGVSMKGEAIGNIASGKRSSVVYTHSLNENIMVALGTSYDLDGILDIEFETLDIYVLGNVTGNVTVSALYMA